MLVPCQALQHPTLEKGLNLENTADLQAQVRKINSTGTPNILKPTFCLEADPGTLEDLSCWRAISTALLPPRKFGCEVFM